MVINGMDCRFGGGAEGVGTENSIQPLTKRARRKYREKTNVDLYDRQYCYISNPITVVTTDTSDMNRSIILSFTMLFVLMLLLYQLMNCVDVFFSGT